MSFVVSLFNDSKLSHNVKYRNAVANGTIYSTTAVNIGNFSNLNIFVNNSVELSCNYGLASNATHIKIEKSGHTTIGYITDITYINDSNTNISYNVDAFSSARTSGMIQEMKGICDRVNMVVADFRSNLQGEPFTPSDIQVVNPVLNASMNTVAESVENMNATWDGINSSSTSIVLTVSPAIIEYLGVGAWGTPSAGFAQTLKNKATLSFYGNDVTSHAGGTYRGTPLKFSNMNECLGFIRQILGGCGFRTGLSANGVTGQNQVNYHSYITNNTTGAGQASYAYRNELAYPMESIRFITVEDIYNVYCIPNTFAQPLLQMKYNTGTPRGFKTLANLHKWGAENSAKNKLLSHPYYYVRVLTAAGDIFNIVPQSHFFGDANGPFVNMWVRYIGGDSPKLQGMLGAFGGGQTNPTGNTSASEWFTIRNYPSVTLSVNDSYNPQLQKDVESIRKTQASYANSVASSQLSNPFKQGYLDGVNGKNPIDNKNASTSDSLLGFAGGIIGFADKNLIGGGNIFEDKNKQQAQNERRSSEAGNIISAVTSSISGNDFLAQYSVPAFAVYDCGATDTEMFTFSRYIDEYGQACNCIVNPLTNAGTIFGGEGTITAVTGRTFYQFGNIEITGVMPNEWKTSIKSLFESGVYIYDN